MDDRIHNANVDETKSPVESRPDEANKDTTPTPFNWPDLNRQLSNLSVRVRLGRVKLPYATVCQSATGTVMTLDRALDEPVDIVVDGQLVAWGRLVVVDNKMAVEVTRLMGNGARRAA